MIADSRFYEIEPNLVNYWRAIILFGKNVASYKFALAKALYDLKDREHDLVKMEELASLFVKHIVAHLRICDKQGTSAQSQFLTICRQYRDGLISSDEQLIKETVRLGFNNVIDAFHHVHGKEIEKNFFLDERKQSGGLRLTNDFYSLANQLEFNDLLQETEGRWRLVETAWNLSLPTRVVQISYDTDTNNLQVPLSSQRRVNITSSRNALNGYQKGRCFYCFRPISLDIKSPELADVDHFFPHSLKNCTLDKPIDGVANLVLACKSCNRGEKGKFDRLPALKLLERLYKRNEYLIKSHHPLRETLMLQTGVKEYERRDFLQNAYNCASIHIMAKWEPVACGIEVF